MLSGLIKSMRPRQWPKNGFVFVALLFDGKMFHLPSVLAATGAFVLLCLMSGAVYLMNDLVDIESDRLHPTKKNRPLPSGQVTPKVAAVIAVASAAISLVAGYFLSMGLAAILLIYLLTQIAYTFKLKHVVLIDVLTIAAGFVLRIAAGVAVIEVERFSPWLYVFGGFLALFMALGKRRAELVLLGGNASDHRAILDDYSLELIDRLQGIVTTSSVVAYSLYTFLAEGLPENHAMMLTIPFVLYGIFRYLYLIHIRNEGGAPEDILLRDRPMQITLILYGVMVFAALYLLS
ncbi:MAG: decaprenyl-phosphate phosphoribosyltransferase [Candidatus Promineofilum sp.]|nr:decaprenyl-phosphate phosphoribosyltransferase [Promineifilum sp.]MBP9657306.1 decaprenyl-phosphate phosphoribosyltransferase [Promineifilum sp.]